MNIPAGTWAVDPSHSAVTFSVKHLMISKVKGAFDSFAATATTDGTVEGTKGEATIDVNSINTKDVNRDGHLKSADFFDVENFPTMTMTTRKFTQKSDEMFTVNGDLTIRNITRPVTFVVELGGVAVDPNSGATKLAAEATFKINREDFGLTWNAALETGGVLVGTEITVNIEGQMVLEEA